jgi:hypothetical protein
MKNTALLILAFFLTLGFSACEDEVALDFVARQPATELEFTNAFLSEYVISQETENNIAERFVWEPVDFGAPVNVTYELQASTDPTFETFELVGTTSENQLAVSVGTFVDLAEELGMDNDPATDNPNIGTVFFRLKAFTGTGGANTIETFSEIQPLNIRWLETGVEASLRNLFLVGDATAAGWDPNNNNTPLFRDPDNPDVYFYTGRFNAGEIKLLEERGQWQPQWGTNDGVTLAVNDGTGSDPGAFEIPAEGYYIFEVNIDAGTFSITPYDASGDPTYSTIGIIGDATANGWGDPDTDMTQSAFNPHLWFINGVTLSDGEMKFRANDSWDTNWGGSTSISGMGSLNGPNIPVTAGTYDIWFNDITGRYIFLPQE